MLGIVTTAIGHEIVQHSHTQATNPSWLATILGGLALFLVGRARLEHLVFARVSRRRIVGIALLAAASPLMGRVSPLGTATTASAVLLLIAVLDWRDAAGQAHRRSRRRPADRRPSKSGASMAEGRFAASMPRHFVEPTYTQ